MKINETVYVNGNLEYASEDGAIYVVIEHGTGDIIGLEYNDATVHTLYSFMSKVKSAYNRRATKQALENLSIGGE